MTDKAEFVVVPREPTQEMVKAAYNGCHFSAESFEDFREALRYGIAASPKFEAVDAVEVAYQAWDHCTSSSKLVAMRSALAAAFPELVTKIKALEDQVAEMDSELSSLRAGYAR